jgi:hypothetical protein
MKAIFATQSTSLRLFAGICGELESKCSLTHAGFVVADSWFYHNWCIENPSFESNSKYTVVKEWEVVSKERGYTSEKLRYYEELLGTPGLFGAIVADRRLLYGKHCTFSQDYTRRMSDEALLSILEVGLIEVEKLFNEVEPEVVFGFICVTFLEYLVYLFARAKGIKYVNLRPLRVRDRVALNSTINDPSPELAEAYLKAINGNSGSLKQAKDFINETRQGSTSYEGTVAPSSKPAVRVAITSKVLSKAYKLISDIIKFRMIGAHRDNHNPGIVTPLIFRLIINPLRARVVKRYFHFTYIRPPNASTLGRYAFFPMHTEPEVSLLVNSRPLLNQLETIRALALSLPADMFLIVKEHPGMVGKRHRSYYKKLLQIPKVKIAAPESDARAWIKKSSLVCVLSSSVGLEAVILEKPVLCFGHCGFELLPKSMVEVVGRFRDLQKIIAGLIERHIHDETALEHYISAVYDCTVGVNFYTTLLGKTYGNSMLCTDYDVDVTKLVNFILSKKDDEIYQKNIAIGQADW